MFSYRGIKPSKKYIKGCQSRAERCIECKNVYLITSDCNKCPHKLVPGDWATMVFNLLGLTYDLQEKLTLYIPENKIPGKM